MDTLNQIEFLRGVHFRSIGLLILSARQPIRSRKVARDVRQAKKENQEIDSYIHLYAMKEYTDYYANIGEELPF